ncbi:hypothetical protein [Nonomuraea gerenzanensis]|uniref:Uncharacterized protein n=1 Tax=Nonomuraea gerenzanensis TaxID=93944 RepID=A0A1M4E425_9ACTN|nr:hypothetical protein [Nonomuraea gerenzanensis]UBU15826.1 hypothetical protein LCN96_12685 [Nonomuraea gerenzanensis]SBO93615.1 hypothetical protein BN4615_P3129 [Nonomuraea gerenzanensis]
MPLYPLYDDQDYDAFGCLFGVRNRLGWTPVAAGRGLPADASEQVRADHERLAHLDGAVRGCTWVSWAELRDLDMTVRPAARGVLRIRPDRDSSIHQHRIDDQWPEEVVRSYGVPPMGDSPVGAPAGRWRAPGATLEYGPLTRLDVLGPGTGWEHVFEVMRALARRFGPDGVRLVVWFD